MFGIPVNSPANIFCDNRSVVMSISKAEARLNKKHNAICFHRIGEAAARGMIRVGKEDSSTNTADLLTKVLDIPKRRVLLFQIY